MHGGSALRVAVLDLRPTAESIGEDDVGGLGVPQRGNQDTFRGRDGDVVVIAFESEVPGQATATGIQDDGFDIGSAKQLGIGVEPHDRMLMAVRLHERTTAETGRIPPR
jgi:hypothetical protein